MTIAVDFGLIATKQTNNAIRENITLTKISEFTVKSACKKVNMQYNAVN